MRGVCHLCLNKVGGGLFEDVHMSHVGQVTSKNVLFYLLGSNLVDFDVNTRLIQFQNTPSSSVRLAVKTRIHA